MKKVLQTLNRFLKRWHRYLLTIPLFFIFIIISFLLYSSLHRPTSDKDYKDLFYSDYKLNGVTIPKNLNYCWEKVPVDNPKIKKALENEFYRNAFDQPSTLILHKKAARWFPLIESILKKNGVPDDFKYVAILESGLTNSTSQSGSGGFWGLMPSVARDYGLQVDEQVDERFNIEKSTEVACQIVKDGYKFFGNWTLATAAYDVGNGALSKQMEIQNTKNYYEMDLNNETAMYIYRLLAFKEIISRPEAYGYNIPKRSLFSPIPTFAVKIDSSITDLSGFAYLNGSNYIVLKTMNPWLLKSDLKNPEHKKYTILFPKKGVKIYGMNMADSFQLPMKKDTGNKKPKM
ncbi:lytic transglycosylase domain-containing protein [soil metagenome]